MRLADAVIDSGLARTNWGRRGGNPMFNSTQDELTQRLGEAPVFAADDVAAYYYADPRPGSAFDYPTLAPPYETFFVETTAPEPLSTITQGRLVQEDLPYRWGALFSLVAPAATWAPGQRADDLPPETRWVLRADLVMQHNPGGPVMGPLSSVMYSLSETGALTDMRSFTWGVQPDGQAFPEEERLRNVHLTYPLLFTLCLLNATNVKQEAITPQLSKRQRLGKQRPLVRYTTLDVHPMREAVRAVAAGGGISTDRALHLCRGHWKDYRETGLFGRNKGVYFWSPQLRGTGKAGVVVKDYNVHAPSPTPDIEQPQS